MSQAQDEDVFRKWTTDAHGNRVMRGLTKSETEEYQTIRSRILQERDDVFPWESFEERSRKRGRWLALHDKHELARRVAVVVEVEARNDKPTMD
jgi:hypothetical protein